MTDLKISQFDNGSIIQITDEIATNRGGVNTKVFVGSAATADIGMGIGDVVAFQDDGGGNSQYPAANGSQITDVETSADLVSYTPSSGSSISSDNVQGAIDELDQDIQSIDLTNVLYSDQTANLTAGYTATAYNAGTKSTGTYTPAASDGNFQRAVNGGAHTLAPPSGDCTMVIQYTNNASAGTITTSGFTGVFGDDLTTVNGDDFFCFITVVNGFSSLTVQALQ